MTARRVLVTGADGFIGSHLTEALVRRGETVRAFVLYNSFNSWGWLDDSPADIQQSLDVVAGDIRDGHALREAAKGCDVILHLAALIAIPFSYRAPASYVETNVTGTLNVLQAARDVGVSRVVHTSTSEVYGTAQRVPIDEEHPLHAQSPYAATKTAADQLALSFFHSYDLPVTVLRPFNTYGPRQSARAVIPTIITQILNGAPTVTLGALAPTRDFNFIADTVRGFIAAMDAPKAVGEVINLGSNFEISIGDTVKVVADVIGRAVEVKSEAERLRRPGSEVERLCAANAKARSLLGWTPEYGGLEGFRRGIAETVTWFKQPSALNRYKADRYNL